MTECCSIGGRIYVGVGSLTVEYWMELYKRIEYQAWCLILDWTKNGDEGWCLKWLCDRIHAVRQNVCIAGSDRRRSRYCRIFVDKFSTFPRVVVRRNKRSNVLITSVICNLPFLIWSKRYVISHNFHQRSYRIDSKSVHNQAFFLYIKVVKFNYS